MSTPANAAITLLDLLHSANVRIAPEVKLEEILVDRVRVIDKQWRKTEIPADTVVLALGTSACSATVEALAGIVRDTYVIGDCRTPGNLKSAVHEAFNIAVESI